MRYRSPILNETSRIAVVVSLALGLGLATARAADGSALGELAEATPVGQWRELQTSGLFNAVKDNGSSLQIVTYGYEMEWHPQSREIFFLGGDHNGCEKFISYSTLQNQWTIEPRPSFLPSCPTQNHSYNYNALDPTGGSFFYANNRYNIASGSWDLSFGLPSGPYYERSNWSAEWTSHGYTVFAKTGSGQNVSDSVFAYNFQTGNWSNIGAGTGSSANIHVLSQYNPTSKIAIFGGGDNTNRLYRLDEHGAVTRLQSGPIPVLTLHPNSGVVVTPEPVSGGFLFYTASGQFYHLDAETDTWTALSSQNLPFAHVGTINHIASVAVPEYGVVAYIQVVNYSYAEMWIYRYADGSAPVDTTPPSSPVGFSSD